jgi:biotin carboxyl carrier protein
MVMLSHAGRRSDDPRSEPYEELGDDGGGQGEVVVLPLQFVVAPDYGRFHLASLPPGANGSLTVARGTVIGEVRNGARKQAIRSPFVGQVDVWLVWDGQIVAPGQPLCSLRFVSGVTEGR